MSFSQVLQFPSGCSVFHDAKGNKITPDVNGNYTLTDSTQLAVFLNAGFKEPVLKPVTILASSASINPDFSVGNDFALTLGVNTTLNNPSNMTIGQQGMIRVQQDATGSRTMAFGSYFKFVGGSKTLSTAASAIDTISYEVVAANEILCELLKAYA
jgi:hypothetical protein